jgi:hypothetical protein
MGGDDDFAYIHDITEPLIRVLTHHSGLPPHLRAAHAASAEFWFGEVRHRLVVIDGYHSRFKRLREAQAA